MNRAVNSETAASQLCQQANVYVAQHKLKQAVSLCHQALKLQPNFAPAYKIMGVVWQLQGKLEEAKYWYNQALEIQPDFAEVYGNLGSLSATQQQWEQAIKSYETALQLQPNLAGVYRNLARIWQKKNQPEKAANCQYEAFLLEPEKLQLEDYFNLGETLSKQSKFEKVINLYSQALNFYPQKSRIYYLLGKALSQQDQWQEAIYSYQKAIELNPNANHYYNSLGDAFTQLKQWDEAINYYLQSIQLNPDFCWSYFKLADAYMECQQWEEAITAYRQGLKLNPEHYWPYIKMGDAFIKQGKIEEAIVTYNQVLEVNPYREQYQYYYDYGNILLLKKQWDDASNYFIQALEIKPDFILVYHKLAEIFDAQKQPEIASICRQNKKLPSGIIQKFLGLEKDWSIPVYSDPKITLLSFEVTEGNIDSTFNSNKEKFFVALVSNGRVWGDAANSLVINSENKVIEGFYTGCPELVISSKKLPPAVELDETIAFFSVQWGRDYFHWMLDILPQFYLLQKVGIKLDSIDKFVINSDNLSFHKEALTQLGIDKKKVITSQDYPHIKATKIVVPIPQCNTRSRIQHWACDFVRNSILSPKILENMEQKERIYINRDRASSRRVVNQELVNILLKRFQFKNVFLELMSLEEQAVLFASAKIIVSPHGAGLTNLIFCQPKTKVIEIFSPTYTPELYEKICQFYRLEYFRLLGTKLKNPLLVERNQDIRVDCDQLCDLLLRVIE